MNEKTKGIWKGWLESDWYCNIPNGEILAGNPQLMSRSQVLSEINDAVIASYRSGEAGLLEYKTLREISPLIQVAEQKAGVASISAALDAASRVCFLQRKGILFVDEED